MYLMTFMMKNSYVGYINRKHGVIKTTITLLIKQGNVKIENKSVLKKTCCFLIALITLSLQQSNGIEFDIRGIIIVIGCY